MLHYGVGVNAVTTAVYAAPIPPDRAVRPATIATETRTRINAYSVRPCPPSFRIFARNFFIVFSPFALPGSDGGLAISDP